MDSLNHDDQDDVIEAFNSTSRYLDDLLNIHNPYFEGMVNQIYPPELHLNKANTTEPKPPFCIYIFLLQMDMFLLKFRINKMIFYFDTVNVPFLDGDMLRMVYTFRNLLGLLKSAIM